MAATPEQLTAQEQHLTQRFLRPERHLARLSEQRSEDEQQTLLAIDDIVASYAMSADDLKALTFWVRSAYRRPDSGLSEMQHRFLDDLARSLDDQWIDAEDLDDDSDRILEVVPVPGIDYCIGCSRVIPDDEEDVVYFARAVVTSPSIDRLYPFEPSGDDPRRLERRAFVPCHKACTDRVTETP